MEYKFALATQADIPQIMEVYQSLIGTPGCTWNEHYPDIEIAEADIKANGLYLLKDNDRIIAVASAGKLDDYDVNSWDIENPCEFARLGVRPDYQGRGIGKMCMNYVFKIAREQGFDGVVLLVAKNNPTAIALYEKGGFKRCGEVFMYGNDYYRYQMKVTK